MSNRTDLSNARAALLDLKSDLAGLYSRIIPIEAAGNVARAEEHLQEAIGALTDALRGDVNMTAEQAFEAEA